MSSLTDNPALILTTLDSEVREEISLVLYGRAAICLGFEGVGE